MVIGWGIGWSEDATGLRSATSTDLPGDVPDVTEPNLWFLKTSRSGDPKRPGEFLLINQLQHLIPGQQHPIVAVLIGEPHRPASEPEMPAAEDDVHATVRVRNITGQPIEIANRPTRVSLTWSSGCSDHLMVSRGESTFTELRPGQSIHVDVMLESSFLLCEPEDRSLKLVWLDHGEANGFHAWVGTIEVTAGPEWIEKRERKWVEETWPNGFLKAAGATLNGHKVGAWNYFRVYGDR